MKKISVFIAIVAISVLFIACNTIEDESVISSNEVTKTQLSESELYLKNQLSETAQLIAIISQDKTVLIDLVNAIKAQPKVMEDRIRFKDLISDSDELKSSGGKESAFSAAFKEQLGKTKLKSTSADLINDLVSAGIEIYIPYPIEDYPEGTDIVVTSDPLDNIYENVGYYVSDPELTVMANDELAEKYPVIIVNSQMFSDEKMEELERSQEIAEQNAKLFKEGNLKSVSSSPIDDWYNESKRYEVAIPKIFCLNDYVEGLFAQEGTIVLTGGTVSFDGNTHAVLASPNLGTVTYGLPRKYERYANNGWYAGWFDVNFIAWLDWQPAITQNSLTVYIDLPTVVTTVNTKNTIAWKEYNGILSFLKGVSTDIQVQTASTNMDHLYFSMNYLRERYKYDYTSAGTVWGEDGEKLVLINSVIGKRPAICYNTELLFATYCVNW
ncbi:MAG: hypothetical protein ACOYXB_12675 [Bacteroidota bacterium]